MYVEKEVLPIFRKWVESMVNVVPMSDARRYGQFFVANHIDPARIESRGEVYDFFEKVENYAEMKKAMYSGAMDSQDAVRCENMETLAKGIIWAVQHDGFDAVKHDPIKMWGSEISAMAGKSSPARG